MFKTTIHQSLRAVLTQISNTYNINQQKLLQNYLNEYDCNTQLTIFEYQDHKLLKDCFNNLYISDQNNNLDIIGYINKDNDIIFDKMVQKTMIKKLPAKQKNIQKSNKEDI